MYRCPLDHDHSNLSQVTCLPKENDILSSNVLRALAKIQFQGLTGSISFNRNGDSLRSAAYDIVNLQFVPGSTPTLRKVRSWDRAFKERLQLKKDLIVWKNVYITGARSSQLHVVAIFVHRALDNPLSWLAVGNASSALPGQ